MGLFRKGKTCITAKLHRTDLIICTHSKEGNTMSYSRINTVLQNLRLFSMKFCYYHFKEFHPSALIHRLSWLLGYSSSNDHKNCVLPYTNFITCYVINCIIVTLTLLVLHYIDALYDYLYKKKSSLQRKIKNKLPMSAIKCVLPDWNIYTLGHFCLLDQLVQESRCMSRTKWWTIFPRTSSCQPLSTSQLRLVLIRHR